MKYVLILVWLSVSWDELQIENYVEYPTLKACETHWDDAKSQKGKDDFLPRPTKFTPWKTRIAKKPVEVISCRRRMPQIHI